MYFFLLVVVAVEWCREGKRKETAAGVGLPPGTEINAKKGENGQNRNKGKEQGK